MFKSVRTSPQEVITSQLFDQNTFYSAFTHSLYTCREELYIESPFITKSRFSELKPIFEDLRRRSVQILINTRHPDEHDEPYRTQATEVIDQLQSLGVTVLLTGRLHRKIAIIDRATLWEGSLNILSFSDSCEIMRKIQSKTVAEEMISFLKLRKYLERTEHDRFK